MANDSKHLVSTVFLIIFLLFTLFNFIVFPILISLVIFVLILLPALVYIILGKLTKRWWMSILFTLIIQLIVVCSLGLWIYNDTMALSNNIQTQPKYLFYTENSTILLAYQITALDFNKINTQNPSEKPFKIISTDETSNILKTINQKDKFIFVVSKEFLDKAPDTLTINIQNQLITLPKTAAFEIIHSDNPEDIAINYLVQSNSDKLGIFSGLVKSLDLNSISPELKQQAMQGMGIDKDTIKLAAIGVLTTNTIKSNGAEYVSDSLKNGNIQLKPDYIAFWTLKNLPYREVKPYLPKDIQQQLDNPQLPI